LFLIFILISTFAVAGCKISGVITTSDGVGVEGVTVILDCDDSVDGCDASMSTTTDADGTYVFHKIKPGNYKVKPADDKHTFEPASKNVKVSHKKIARADFEIVTSPTPPPPVSLPPWSTYQGNAAHTGYVPGFLNTDGFSHSWTKNIAAVAELDIEFVTLNPVAAGDGKVFVTTGGDYGPHVAIALNSADGTMAWPDGPYDFNEIDSINPPAYANGIVYIQSGLDLDSYLRAFDAGSGEVLFETPYVNPFARYYAPTIYDVNGNVDVYVGGGSGADGGVYGFDGDTGQELWHAEWNSPYEQWTPAVNKDYVIAYTGYYNPQLTVINRSSGVEKFIIPDPNFDLSRFSGFSMDLAPVLGSQDNVIAIQDGRLISFDLGAEAIGWEIQKKAGDMEGFSGQPSLANGIIYAVYEGSLYALDESDGSFIEGWQPPLEGESIVTPMIVTDNLIFVSTESATYAVDLESQTPVWSYDAGGHLALSDDGVLYIATTEGELHAISTIAMPVE
jgi:outer membrane protein assembly factor BamB